MMPQLLWPYINKNKNKLLFLGIPLKSVSLVLEILFLKFCGNCIRQSNHQRCKPKSKRKSSLRPHQRTNFTHRLFFGHQKSKIKRKNHNRIAFYLAWSRELNLLKRSNDIFERKNWHVLTVLRSLFYTVMPMSMPMP